MGRRQLVINDWDDKQNRRETTTFFAPPAKIFLPGHAGRYRG
jgi:hypothetical protein